MVRTKLTAWMNASCSGGLCHWQIDIEEPLAGLSLTAIASSPTEISLKRPYPPIASVLLVSLVTLLLSRKMASVLLVSLVTLLL
jgi:hypothetical protein